VKTYLRSMLVLASLIVLLGAPLPARAAGTTITVNTTDGGITDDGFCSLREALNAAATNADVVESGPTVACPAGNAVDPDTIAFHLPGSGVQTINLVAYLPVSSPVIIDGTTDPDYAGSPVVRIDGNNASMYGMYLDQFSFGSTIKGLMLTRFGYTQLSLYDSDGSTVVGNYIGTDGVSDLGGSTGIGAQGTQNATIGGAALADRNIIAGNVNDVSMDSGVTGTQIQGNYIGVFADGATSPAGSTVGIRFSPTCCSQGASLNTIGGLGPGEGNVIAGHTQAEIYMASSWNVGNGHLVSDGNTIQGNIIGVNEAGTAAPVAAGNGIRILNSDNTLIEGNVISGKSGSGISLEYDASLGASVVAPTGTEIRSNWIGTGGDGSSDLGNGNGVYLKGAASTTVGGNDDFAKLNVISGNAYGIRVEGGSGNVVDTNWIGMGADGSTPLPRHPLRCRGRGFKELDRKFTNRRLPGQLRQLLVCGRQLPDRKHHLRSQ
jgi:CSLREA domain-containing protein